MVADESRKANQHAQRCRGSLTCIDCSKTFWNGEWGPHNSCISEAQAYQGALYKPTKKELKRKQREEQTSTYPAVDSLAVSNDNLAKREAAANRAAEEKQNSNSKAKKIKTAVTGTDVNAQLALLDSLTTSEPTTLHAILKKIKAQGKADKEAFLKGVSVVKGPHGVIQLI
jgi:cell growth-regulating nucleolar protein